MSKVSKRPYKWHCTEDNCNKKYKLEYWYKQHLAQKHNDDTDESMNEESETDRERERKSKRKKRRQRKKRKKRKQKKRKRKKKKEGETSDVDMKEEDHQMPLSANIARNVQFIKFDSISCVVRNIDIKYSLKMMCNLVPCVANMQIIAPQKYANFSLLVSISQEQMQFFRKRGALKPGDLITMKQIQCNIAIISNEITFYANSISIKTMTYITNIYLVTHETTTYGDSDDIRDLIAKYKTFDDDIDYKRYFSTNLKWECMTDLAIKMETNDEFDHHNFIQTYKTRKRAIKLNKSSECMHGEPPKKKQKLMLSASEIIWKNKCRALIRDQLQKAGVKQKDAESIETTIFEKYEYTSVAWTKSMDNAYTQDGLRRIKTLKDNCNVVRMRLCSAKQMIFETDSDKLGHLKQIAIEIERKCRKMFGKNEKMYAEKLRDICWHIAKNKRLLESIQNKERSIEELLTMNEDELLTNEMKAKRKYSCNKVIKESIDPTKRDSYRTKYILDQKCYQNN